LGRKSRRWLGHRTSSCPSFASPASRARIEEGVKHLRGGYICGRIDQRDGRRFRILAIVDDFTRECLARRPAR
jgi:hypothetical protein